MAQLVVRNLEDDVKLRLQRRAKRHGRSMEEEAREILRTAAKSEQGVNAPLGSRITKRFVGIGLDGEITPLRGRKAEPVLFKK